MPSLLDIRRRIRSVKNTQQLTKAMKTVFLSATPASYPSLPIAVCGRPLHFGVAGVDTRIPTEANQAVGRHKHRLTVERGS